MTDLLNKNVQGRHTWYDTIFTFSIMTKVTRAAKRLTHMYLKALLKITSSIYYISHMLTDSPLQ